MQKLATVLLFACLGMQGVIFVKETRIEQAIDNGVRNMPALEGTAQTLITSWNGVDGLSWEVRTPRNAGEETIPWINRHDEAVAEVKSRHPPA